MRLPLSVRRPHERASAPHAHLLHHLLSLTLLMILLRMLMVCLQRRVRHSHSLPSPNSSTNDLLSTHPVNPLSNTQNTGRLEA